MAETWDFGRGLSGYVWRTPGARAGILLTHGFAEYAERYVERYHQLVPKLNALGLDVYGWDLRGHGRSPGARGVADIREAVADHRAARRALGDKPLFLFGHSLGGLITAASVAEDGANVAGVVLSAPALHLEAPAHLRLIAHTLSSIAPSLRLTSAGAPDRISRIPEEVEAYRTDPRISGLSIPVRLGATALGVAEAAWTRFPAWTAPVLVLHGADDSMTEPKGSTRFIETIASSDKRLELYPEGRHELLNDLDRDAAMGVISAWLSERLARV
jgi:acylglycerol lipase